MSQKITYSVVIPAFGEASIIDKSLLQLAKCLNEDKKRVDSTELIVVAADAGDDTANKALENNKLFKTFRLIQPGKKVGKGRDVREGVLSAKGDYILFLDADMATPPHHIKEAFDLLEDSKADLLIAERPLSKIHNTLSRRVKSVLSNLLIRFLATPGIKDTQCGFKAFTKTAANSLFKPLETLEWGFDIEILVRARSKGYKIVTLSINDWYDPKEDSQGLVGESNLHAYISTLKELFKVSYKRFSGYYKK